MADTSDKLLPCPFCGATAEQTASIFTAGKYAVMLMSVHDFDDERVQQNTHPFYVSCVECGIVTLSYQTREDACAAWNRRHAALPADVRIVNMDDIEEAIYQGVLRAAVMKKTLSSVEWVESVC